jgi:phosphatidylglycerol:prolipoprotein diacylglycerol transferase
MVPFIHVPDGKLGPLTIHPFGVLVATGVLVGTLLATRRARRLGYDLDKLNSFITWMLAFGFIGGHVFDEIFYHPEEVLRRPWSLLMLWEGLSSFGGFFGGIIGVTLWKYFEARERVRVLGFPIYSFHKRKAPAPILAFVDCIIAVFPVAWIFGRSGCSVVHDHPGARAPEDFFLAVAYPNPSPSTYIPPHVERTSVGFIDFVHGDYPRFDLGLLELVVAFFFALTWSRRTAVGSYIVAAALSYAPVRFVMDFFRITEGEAADKRYFALTFAQWSCVALFVFGLLLIAKIRSMAKRGIDPTAGIRAAEAEAPEPSRAQEAPSG